MHEEAMRSVPRLNAIDLIEERRQEEFPGLVRKDLGIGTFRYTGGKAA